MKLLRWFTNNVADTDAPTHPDLAPLALPLAPDDAVRRVVEVIGQLPGWAVVAVDGRTIRATRRTRLWGFLDDVTLRLNAAPGGCVLHARSQSRIGKGDMGQNRRNLRQVFKVVQKAILKS
jgi:uncharacterized protein (DUF1499 family)